MPPLSADAQAVLRYVRAHAGGSTTVTVGTTTTGAAGTSASVTNSGTSTAVVLNFTIPQGAAGATGSTGPSGPANSLAIGTVTTLAAGASATATITGTAPSQTLSLGIPQGAAGATFTPPSLGSVFDALSGGGFGLASTAFSAANAMLFVPIVIPVPATLTGVRYRKGTGTVAANVIAALYNSSGTRVAVSGTVAAGTVASAVVTCPFSGTYSAAAGLYWIGLIGSSTSADYYGWTSNLYLGPATAATQGSFTTPASFTPPATTTLGTVTIPRLATY